MELKLQLSVFVVFIQVSLAVWQRVTVEKGQTVNLRCPIRKDLNTNVDWKNPEGYIIFFNHSKGMKDKRYIIEKLSNTQFTISISNVTFKDGGIYKCSQYSRQATEKKIEVTVLGPPKMMVAKHEEQTVIKCTAEGNHHPPQIFWKMDNGPEIVSHVQVLQEDKKYVSMAMLRVRPVENRVTVKCLVRHPDLHTQPLMNFVKIGRDSTKSRRTTTTSSPTAQPHGSTMHFATRDVNGPSSESSMKLSTLPSNQLFSSNEPKMVTSPTGFPLNPVTSTGSQLSTSGSTRKPNDTISNATSTTGWTSVSEITEGIADYNHTEGNITGSINDPKMQIETQSSSLLVFLVTCLIFCLLVVVIFFAIKLRRAHITWKKENDDSDPSEESNKSKSSQEEKNAQGQKRRGLVNTAFTQYVIEEPTPITSVTKAAAVATTGKENNEQTSQPQTIGQTTAKCDIKETEL